MREVYSRRFGLAASHSRRRGGAVRGGVWCYGALAARGGRWEGGGMGGWELVCWGGRLILMVERMRIWPGNGGNGATSASSSSPSPDAWRVSICSGGGQA